MLNPNILFDIQNKDGRPPDSRVRTRTAGSVDDFKRLINLLIFQTDKQGAVPAPKEAAGGGNLRYPEPCIRYRMGYINFINIANNDDDHFQ